jgi:hypothetical protein
MPARDRCLLRQEVFARTFLVAVVDEADPPPGAKAIPTIDQKAANRAGGTWVMRTHPPG